jgi:hypothetical protein
MQDSTCASIDSISNQTSDGQYKSVQYGQQQKISPG